MFNLVLSGGGIKGMAFSGAYEVAEKRGYTFCNIAGVSAGGIAGSLISAGYNASSLRQIIDTLDFGKIKIEDIPKLVPVVMKYEEFQNQYRGTRYSTPIEFLSMNISSDRSDSLYEAEAGETNFRGNLVKNVALYSKEGCLFDGDYLEEWLFNHLLKRGIRTFADLRGGIVDSINPRGYRARFMAVDAARKKAIVLPDDVVFYNMNPDNLEVAKAVRMSASVPFAFKPVELYKYEGGAKKTYPIVDGGVFDNYPIWMIGDNNYLPTMGFSLDGDEKKKLFSMDTPLKILKSLIAAVNDIGIPKTKNYYNKYLAKINTGQISSFDFNLTEEDKQYLYEQGRYAATDLINRMEISLNRRMAMIRHYPYFF
ncbi:MAG: patatin-like phospholipase family protein [Bacillota bacterium]|nr:patatin-like phospholipase family protein [Bacillota bacterium]